FDFVHENLLRFLKIQAATAARTAAYASNAGKNASRRSTLPESPAQRKTAKNPYDARKERSLATRKKLLRVGSGTSSRLAHSLTAVSGERSHSITSLLVSWLRTAGGLPKTTAPTVAGTVGAPWFHPDFLLGRD